MNVINVIIANTPSHHPRGPLNNVVLPLFIELLYLATPAEAYAEQDVLSGATRIKRRIIRWKYMKGNLLVVGSLISSLGTPQPVYQIKSEMKLITTCPGE